MKTIEQLADEYVGHPEEIDEFSSTTIKRQSFIDGTKIQKDLDDKHIGNVLLPIANKAVERTKKRNNS